MTAPNTKRHDRIMRLLEDGMSHGQIAERLFIEDFDTVKVSKQAIRQLIERKKASES